MKRLTEAQKKPASARRLAFLEAIAFLEYRAAVCRKTEADWAEKNGAGSRGCATERAARFELEHAIREIARIGNMRRTSREYRNAVAERAAFVAAQTASPAALQGDRDVDA